MANQFLDILKPSTKPSIQQLKEEARIAQQEAEQANSFKGILMNTIKGIPKATGEVAKDIGQSVARTVGTVGVTAGNVPTQLSNKIAPVIGAPKQPLPFDPETPTTDNSFSNSLFGGKPIRTLSSAGRNARTQANEFLGILKGEEAEVPMDSPVLDIGYGFAGVLFDLTGFGGKAGLKTFTKGEIPEQFFKFVAKEKNPAVIESTLKKVGLDDINAKNLADELAPTRTPKQAKDVIGNYGDIQAETNNSFKNILKGEVKPPSDMVPVASNALPSVEQRVVNITGEAPQPVPITIEQKANNLAGIENKPATANELPKTQQLEVETTTEPITVYRGEGKGIGNTTLVKGQYLADTKDFAKNFGEVTEETIPAGAKVFNLDAVKTGEGSIPQEMLVDKDKLTSYLIDNGFDYTKNINTRGVEYVKLNKTLNELEDLAQKSKSLSDFKRRVMESYDYYRGELARISKGYSVADHSRMRSPMEDVYNRVNKLKIPKTGEVVFDRTTKEIEAGLERVFGRKIPMREVFNADKELGNKNAVGRAFKSGIRLLKENNSLSEAVANHEGYHWAKMNMPAEDAQRLNKLEEQLKLARPKEAQRIRDLGYSEDQIAEEMGANEFAKFYQTGKTTFAKLRIFFEKMLQKLKMIFGKRGKLLKEFSDIKTTVAKEGERAPPKARFEKTDVKRTANEYKGEKDLTTKILKDLEGKTTVSKQYILDATNRGELKQVERDLIRQVLEGEKDVVNVKEFADKVKAELLPLKVLKGSDKKRPTGMGNMYEDVTLPSELRGSVKNYDVNIYESPIKTSAGDIHFGSIFSPDVKNYFGHTRIEDMADNKTRRVIEVQSDLYQKGNLEKEQYDFNYLKEMEDAKAKGESYSHNDYSQLKGIENMIKNGAMEDPRKLQQYNDPTAHFRMVREEIKKASQDGKTKLQFPTGETAMKIEGLGNAHNFALGNSYRGTPVLDESKLKVGAEVYNGDSWIITDVLGDGKFKAVPKDRITTEFDNGGGGLNQLQSDARGNMRPLRDWEETFDISGKVDTNNPIYKFYEKEMGRYLKNKYNAKLVTDNKGVNWYEVDVKPEMSGPVEAFKMGEASQIDRLIAEGKIRVVSRDRKDIYQVKKGGEWVNAQSEDSAILMANPKPKVEKPLPPELQRQKDYIDIKKEAIQLDRAQVFLKYVDPKLGGLPEVGKNQREIGNNRKVSKWRLEGDSLATEAGFESSDQAREAVDELILRKREIRALEKDFRTNKAQFEETKKEADKLSIQKIIEDRAISSAKEALIPRIDTVQGEGRSLEIIAEQAQREANGIDSGDISSLPKIISDTVTPVNKKINLLDYIRTPDRVLQKIGFGNQARKLEEGYINYVKELPKNIDRITKILAKIPDPKGQLAVFRWLDGKAVTLGGKELEVAVEIKSWLQEWAKRLKLEKDEKISHYITHLFNDEIIEKEFPEELAKIITDKIPKETYDPFLQERMGALGYKEDLGAALDAYVKRATRKVHMDPALEEINAKAGSSLEFSNIEASQFKYLQKYIEGVQMRPTWIDNLVDNTIKGAFGYKFGQRPLTRTLRVLRQMTYRGMLGLNPGSALRNISQGVNTFAVLGPRYTSLGYAKLFNPGAIKELSEEGILNSGFVQDRVLSATKKNLERLDKGLFVFFDTAEKINRGSAYFGAKAKYINRNKMMMKEIGGKVEDVEEEAKKYAREIVRKTQFSFSSIDTPVALQSDIVKTMTQFGTFSIKQAEFLAEMAKDKNFMGLLRYALAGMAFVYTVGQAFGMKKEELIPFYSNITRGEGPFGSMPSLKFPKELIKAGLNVPDKYGKERDLKTKAMDVAKSAIGLIPAGTQMKKTFEGISSIQDGGSFDKAGNLQFTQDVSIAGKAQAVLFGKYASNEAQTYFNKVEINKEKKANIKPVYDEVQKLKNDGNEAEAQAIVDELSDEDYETYKSYKQEQKTKQTLAGKKAILPTYLEVQDLIKEGKQAEAQEIVNALSDEQYEYYTLVKKQVEKDKKADDGTMPKYEDGEAQTEKGVVGTVFLYAKAIGADPVVAFNRIFTNQKIRRIDNGAIVVERMPFEKSTEVKKKRGSSGDMKLDHTIPLQLGGSNSEDNLNLVENVLWESYTPVENYLGNKLRTDKISKKDAQRLIKDFKEGKISAEDVYNY